MQRVFISYSRKDIEFARQLSGDLEKAGFKVWWDISDLKSGDEWVRTIPAAIEASRYFIILLSPDAVASQWVEREYLHALNLRRKVIPLMVRPCSVPFALANINYLDFTVSDPVTSFNRLLADLEYTGEPVVATTLPKKRLLPLPPSLVRFERVILAGLVLALFILSFFVFKSFTPVIPTPTSTASPSPSWTVTPTRELTATQPATPTLTPSLTSTETSLPEITMTPSSTREAVLRVELCIRTDFTTLVRTGPGKAFGYLSNPLKGDDCLLFSARNEDSTWFMIAPRQPDARFREFEYGWVSNFTLDLESAGTFSLPVGTPLPTATRIPSLTPSPTSSPTETNTPIPTDTRVPTSTATDLPVLEPTPTS
jgi:hypothetical protein